MAHLTEEEIEKHRIKLANGATSLLYPCNVCSDEVCRKNGRDSCDNYDAWHTLTIYWENLEAYYKYREE